MNRKLDFDEWLFAATWGVLFGVLIAIILQAAGVL